MIRDMVDKPEMLGISPTTCTNQAARACIKKRVLLFGAAKTRRGSQARHISGSVTDVSIRTYARKPHSRDAALLSEGLKTGKIDIGAIPFYPTIMGISISASMNGSDPLEVGSTPTFPAIG